MQCEMIGEKSREFITIIGFFALFQIYSSRDKNVKSISLIFDENSLFLALIRGFLKF